MDMLPDDVFNMIFKYKHQLEMCDILNELTQIRINCRYIFSLSFVKSARYITHQNEIRPCIDINNIDVYSYEILDLRRSKKLCHL
jgi:hypothetical protein